MTLEPLILPPVNPQPSPGEWYVLQYGFDRKAYYVTDATDSLVKFSCKNWLSDGGHWKTHNEFFGKHEASYIGKGHRTLASYLPLIGNLFPKYTQP
jgi:hypothetical protein